MQLRLGGSDFILLPEKAIYKTDESILIIADVHLGKASHFRKSGLSIPASVQMNDFENLRKLFLKIAPHKVYFLGDLFHSKLNNDWAHFTKLILEFPTIQFTLIKGNHDIINKELFRELDIKVVEDLIETDDFIYAHEPLAHPSKITFAGHIHPGILLTGPARQSVTLPCFHFSRNVMTLPAFGILTGYYKVTLDNSRVFAVLPNVVREL
jgi:DNA ligase-associated metallophosphoesterase